jgi:hypothetical protein
MTGVQLPVPALMGIFLFATASRPALGPIQPPNQWVPGAVTPGVKWPGRKADHSPPSSADVKNEWSYNSAPPYVFLAWYLIKERMRYGVVLCKVTSELFMVAFSWNGLKSG